MMTPSARRAAFILADAVAPPAPATLSAGESERLELVDALAIELKRGDPVSRAVCRRLLGHLCAPIVGPAIPSRLQ
jgi:hypothetical protein